MRSESQQIKLVVKFLQVLFASVLLIKISQYYLFVILQHLFLPREPLQNEHHHHQSVLAHIFETPEGCPT